MNKFINIKKINKMIFVNNKMAFNKNMSFNKNMNFCKYMILCKNMTIGKNIEINKVSKNILNMRKNDFTGEDSNKWEYMTKKNLEESKINNKIWNSRFGNINTLNLLKLKDLINKNKIYMSDFIMFNQKCKLTFNMIDIILPYIKFKKIDSDTIQIDKWLFTNINLIIMTSDRDRPNYNILWSNDELYSNEFVKTKEDKFLVIKAMIQIMNETPDKYVNFNSYKILSYSYIKYKNQIIF
jgi:hypothetical protein